MSDLNEYQQATAAQIEREMAEHLASHRVQKANNAAALAEAHEVLRGEVPTLVHQDEVELFDVAEWQRQMTTHRLMVLTGWSYVVTVRIYKPRLYSRAWWQVTWRQMKLAFWSAWDEQTRVPA